MVKTTKQHPGECVIALKSMIGSTAQQFLTYLSHRGEETGNIRGSMKVRVPSERQGTRERLYEWISIDKDESGATKGKPQTVSREYVRSVSRKQAPGETAPSQLTKMFDEPEKANSTTAGRPPAPCPATLKEDASLNRTKSETQMDTDAGMKNCFNNPAYYVLEGVPHQLLTENSLTSTKPPAAKNKVPITVPVQLEKRCPPSSSHPSTRGEESSSDDDVGTMNLPPPDFPPPPLPKTVEFEMVENPFYVSSKEVQAFATPKASIGKEQMDVRTGVTKPKAGVAFCEPLESKLPSKPHPLPAQSSVPRVGVTFATEHQNSTRKAQGATDDHSFSVLQMARTLSEVDNCDSRSGPTGRGQHGRTHLPPERGPTELPLRGYHSDYSQPITFPSRCIRESIKEDLDEEGLYQSERSSSSLSESGVGDWLRALGMERYEAGLLHNGWDDLEFLSDITQEDLQEAGVQDHAHRKVILDNLKLLKK